MANNNLIVTIEFASSLGNLACKITESRSGISMSLTNVPRPKSPDCWAFGNQTKFVKKADGETNHPLSGIRGLGKWIEMVRSEATAQLESKAATK